jgi:DNA-binding winged helix-turn-helix (wHTH) protein
MADLVSSDQVIRFGVFEFDIAAGELRKRGVRLNVQGLPLQILAILAAKPGTVVAREELRNRLWPADTFVDFDHSIRNAVARLRETLDDSAETPRYIETLPRRGYRFIGVVEAPSPAAKALPAQPSALIPPPATGASARKKIVVLVALGIILAASLFAAVLFLRRNHAPPI